MVSLGQGGVRSSVALPDRQDHGAEDFLRQGADHLLDQLHHRLVVHVGPVEFHHGELGVVDQRDALVAEVAADLVDLVEAAHHHPLEVQLGRDAQVEVDVERVVVRGERPGEGAPRQRLEDGRLDLDEAPVLEVAAHARDDGAAHAEPLGDLGVGDQVGVPLPVAGLDVLQAVALLGRRAERLGQQGPRFDRQRELAAPSAEHPSFTADDVAQVEIGERAEGLLAQAVDAPVDLQVVPAVTKGEKGRLAVLAPAHHPAGDAEAVLGLFARGQVTVGGDDLAGRRPRLVAARVRVDTRRPETVDLGGLLAHQALGEPSELLRVRTHGAFGLDALVRRPRPHPPRRRRRSLGAGRRSPTRPRC